jgi:glycerophosphoryl diester phosphodiesterase
MPGVELIAHRGASHDAPENTLAAFRLAWNEGADGIEGDFRLTRDGEIVCLHDAKTGRTAGTDLAVADLDLAQLRQLDAGKWRGSAWAGERIPTLREVIATMPPGKRLFIELKSGKKIIVPLKENLAATGLPPECFAILSFQEEVVAEARKQIPLVAAYWLSDFRKDRASGSWTPGIDAILEVLRRSDASGLAARACSEIDEAFVRALRAAKRECHVWTVNAPRVARRFGLLGVDSIFTDRPGWLRHRLEAHGR